MSSTRDRSLKRDGVKWSGVDERALMEPLPGQFAAIQNAYVSKEGTEIRRVPGWRKVADVTLGETWAGTVVVAEGATTSITFSGNHYLGTGDYVIISGNTTTPTINGTHAVTRVNATQVTIAVVTTGGTPANNGTFILDRIRHVHGFKQCDGDLVVVGEFKASIIATSPQILSIVAGDPVQLEVGTAHGYEAGETFSVTISGTTTTPSITGVQTATAIDPFRFTVPVAVTTVTYAYGYAAPALSTTAIPVVWHSPSKPSISTPISDFTIWKSSVWRNYPTVMEAEDLVWMWERSALEVTDNRVIIASPGVGICHQVDIGSYHRNFLPIEVIALGMPKGMVSSRTTFSPTGGTMNVTAGDKFYVAAAVESKYTGMVGLISEPMEVEATTTATGAIHVYWAEPWECLREVPSACNILLFYGDSAGSLQFYKSISRSVALGDSSPTYEVITETPTQLRARNALSDDRDYVIEQMPMGCKALRTTRGFTLFGGLRGTAGRLRESLVVVDGYVIPGATTDNECYILARFDTHMVGGAVIPSAWQGVRIEAPPADGPYVRTLDKLWRWVSHGPFPDITGHVWQSEIAGRGYPPTPPLYIDHYQSRLMLRQGHMWVSEQGYPYVAVATRQIPVDIIRGQDIEGIARIGDGWIVCSALETYFYQFSRSPLETQPAIVSDQVGCIGAPNAMVEVDGGVIGLGHNGPWVSTGGRPMEVGDLVGETFADCKRDSRGFMRHAIAAWDSDREIAWIGLRKDQFTTDYNDAPDDAYKGKIGCDFFLIYSPENAAWSTWQPPEHIGEIYWMDEVWMDDGTRRLAFLARDPNGQKVNADIYVFDDDSVDSMASVVSGVISASGVGSSKTTFLSTDTIGTGAGTAVGMSFFVTNATSGALTAYGTISSIISATEVGITGSWTFTATDTIYIGEIPVTLTTRTWPWMADWQGQSMVQSVQMRHEFDSAAPTAFMRTSITAQFAAPTGTTVTFAAVPMLGLRTRAERACHVSPEHAMTIVVHANERVRIKDIILEEGPGG